VGSDNDLFTLIFKVALCIKIMPSKCGGQRPESVQEVARTCWSQKIYYLAVLALKILMPPRLASDETLRSR
jgi:hypothetical protein